MRFFTRASKWFQKLTPEEAPYPQRALADKLDPFIMEEWSGLMQTAKDYVEEILRLAGYKKYSEIADGLVTAFPSHEHVITPEKAKEIGLNVRHALEYQRTWEVMRFWLTQYVLKQEMTHCIRYALPESQGDAKSGRGNKKMRRRSAKPSKTSTKASGKETGNSAKRR